MSQIAYPHPNPPPSTANVDRGGSLYPGLFVLSLVALIALTLAYQAPFAYDLTTRGLTLSGFHALEGSGDHRFRWSDGHALIGLAGVGQQPYRLTLTLSGPRPSNVELPSVRVSANGTPLASFKATRALQDYSFEIPREVLSVLGDLDLQIESETFVPPNDLRTLGVALYAMRLETFNSQRPFTWPALMPLLWCVITVVALQLFVRAVGMPRELGLALPLILLAVISAGIATQRLPTVAALPWLALASITAYSGAEIKQRTRWRETVAALAVGLSALHFALEFLNLFRISRFSDVTTMFEAAQKLAQGIDPYDYTIVRDNPLYAHSYVYPPPFAQFLELFLPFGMNAGIIVWVVLNFGLYGIVLIGLARMFGLRWRSFALYAFLLVALNYRPVLDTLYGGQLDVSILALLLACLVLAQRQWLIASGAALAFATITKLHPLLLLPFYLTTKRWRGFIGFGLALALILSVSMLFISPELYMRYVTIVLPGRGGEGTGNAENQSVSAFLYRLNGLVWDDVPTPAQAGVIRVSTYGIAALLSLATVGAMWRSILLKLKNEKMQTSLHFSSFIALMLLVLPTSWMHYETQLLLPLAALLSYAVATDRRALFIVWGVGAALTAFANQDIFRGGELDAWPLVLLQSYKFYGVLLVWAALVWASSRWQATESSGAVNSEQ